MAEPGGRGRGWSRMRGEVPSRLSQGKNSGLSSTPPGSGTGRARCNTGAQSQSADEFQAGETAGPFLLSKGRGQVLLFPSHIQGSGLLSTFTERRMPHTRTEDSLLG